MVHRRYCLVLCSMHGRNFPIQKYVGFSFVLGVSVKTTKEQNAWFPGSAVSRIDLVIASTIDPARISLYAA